MWLIFKMIFMYFFIPWWFKISKKLLVEKVFLIEKPCFKLFLSIAMEKWIRLILGRLIRVSFSSTLFSNFRDFKQFRSFHRAILTIWYVYSKRWHTSHLTFLWISWTLRNIHVNSFGSYWSISPENVSWKYCGF